MKKETIEKKKIKLIKAINVELAKRNLTHQQLADHLGCSRKYISSDIVSYKKRGKGVSLRQFEFILNVIIDNFREVE